MNSDIIRGKWREIKGAARVQWGRLTDDELDEAEGNVEKLAGLVQQRYGYERDRAQQEVDTFLRRYDRP